MLTIENIHKIKNSVISYPYYISEITPIQLYEPMTFNSEHWYHIEVTKNKKETLLFKLNRELKKGIEAPYVVIGYELRLGKRIVHITKGDIECMNGLIDWMEYLILQSKSTTLI